jgi:hypothetical protein
LDYGTKEASFLSAFCPIDDAPTLVIIHNGTVVDKLEGNLEYTEWAQRLLKACGNDAQGTSAGDSTQPREPMVSAPTAVETTDETNEGAAVPVGESASGSAAPSLPGVPPEHQPENIQALLSERGQRLEAERLRREGREKAERIARARALREEQERAQSQSDKGKQRAEDPDSAKNKARVDWMQQQAKRKTEAKEEKQRIMARIEADKRERKNREVERKQAATAMAGEPLPSTSSALPGSSSSTKMPPTSGTCALQVRLFDGSSIKGRFKHDSTLATAVREWIKETSPAGGADIPFNFRQILTPHPSRTIEISEEGQTLSDVGLMPTATLVLVPVAGFTEAYSGGGSGGILGSAYGMVSGAFGLAGSALGYVTGFGSSSGSQGEGIYMGGTADEQEPSNVQGSRMANADSGTAQSGPSRIRVKTMAEQRAESDKGAEFYNGNSLGTEGRKDDDGGAGGRQ